MMTNRPAARQIIISLSILILCSGVLFGLKQLKGSPEKEEEVFQPPLVQVRTLSPESVKLTISSQGIVKPATETRLVAEVSGVVNTVSPVFVSGAVFKKGDVLARLDDSDYQVALRQAEASLAASKARLAEEIAKAEAEKKNWLRSGKKLKDAPGLLLRKPYVAEARANVKAADAQLEQAKRDLDKTLIKAPYDGMVRERMINVGQFLSLGTEVGTLFSVDYSEIRLPIKPSDLEFIDLSGVGRQAANAVKVTLEQRLGRRHVYWPAHVARVEGVVDEYSRMHFLVVQVADPYGLQTPRETPLKSGSFVYAHLEGQTVDSLFRLPRSSLYGSGKVMVLAKSATGQDILTFRQVELVYASESDVYVTGELAEGDQVCLTPISNAIEGMQVRSQSAPVSIADKKNEISLSKG